MIISWASYWIPKKYFLVGPQCPKKTNTKESLSDTAHVTILKNILNNDKKVSGANLARFEKRHRSVGGNALRAAVLGETMD